LLHGSGRSARSRASVAGLPFCPLRMDNVRRGGGISGARCGSMDQALGVDSAQEKDKDSVSPSMTGGSSDCGRSGWMAGLAAVFGCRTISAAGGLAGSAVHRWPCGPATRAPMPRRHRVRSAPWPTALPDPAPRSRACAAEARRTARARQPEARAVITDSRQSGPGLRWRPGSGLAMLRCTSLGGSGGL
jgi:hypothetical protein